MENKEMLRKNTKINSPQYESEFWKAVEVYKELKLIVNEQQYDIKILKNNVTWTMKIKFRKSKLQ